MAVVDFHELYKHAVDGRYQLTVIGIQSLAVIGASLRCAEKLDAPVVLAVAGDDLDDGLLPSVEAMVQRASVPVALVGQAIKTAAHAVLAIRLGCNALHPADGLDDVHAAAIRETAASCGVPLINDLFRSAVMMDISSALELDTLLPRQENTLSWRKFDETVGQAVSATVSQALEQSGSAGQGRRALENCSPWSPVEHLIVYNTTTDDNAARELAAEGRRVLDGIPGVRATWSGRSVRADAAYRWCWLIRFANTAVIDSYRDHPDHVRYADNHFRPVAGNRISIDYLLTGVD